MDFKETVIFLDYFEELQDVVPLVRRIREKLKSDPVVVSSNFDAGRIGIYSDLKVIYFDSLLSKEDYCRMDRWVLNMVEGWYSRLMTAEGITEYSGIRFGEVDEERAQRLFTPMIKNLHIVLKIIDRLKPDYIIMIGEREIFGRLSKLIKKELNISARFIEFPKRKIFKKEAKRYVMEAITDLCDPLIRNAAVSKKKIGSIFIDTRLYFEFRELGQDFQSPYLFLIEKGLGIRLKLILLKERLRFVPITLDGTLVRLRFNFSFRRYWNFYKKDTAFKNGFTYEHIPIWILLEGILQRVIVEDFASIKKNIVLLEKVFMELKPKIVILREAVRTLERIIVESAKRAGAATLVIQHGILAERYGYTKLSSDKIALWGKAGIDWYGAYGNDISKCAVTGKPAHDRLYRMRGQLKEKARNTILKMGLHPDKDTVLYIPSYFKDLKYTFSVFYSPDMEHVSLDSVLKAMSHFPEKQLIVKVHPFDAVDLNALIENKIKKYPNVLAVKDADILPLIESSSVVIVSLFSSSALDALILGKPLITLNIHKRKDLVPFAEYGAALGVTDSEQLSQAITSIFEDKDTAARLAGKRAGFVYDYAYRIDGKSTERIWNLVENLCRGAGQKNEDIINKSSM